MKVLHSWLREFVPALDTHPVGSDPAALGDLMSSLGLCCEEIELFGHGLDGIVVAKVLELSPHPDADRIQLVQVDVGDGQPLQICCGAFNMAVGDHVPLATLGSTMPDGMAIARRKMRGEWSNGMLCSGRELGLGSDHSGILILPPTAVLGSMVTDALAIEPDALYDLDLTPNRPDALSHRGVARDIAAALGLPFADPEPVVTEEGESAPARLSINIHDSTLCGRFTARLLSQVPTGSSPRWMQERLERCGMRPISAVVDTSNYVMLELGHPNHTYDLDTCPGGALAVRRARDGEEILTLDGQTRVLSSADGVVVDGNDRPVGIAGVMGGADTEISDSTTSVLLELAWWRPADIGAASKRLGLRSEASARYERGVDPDVAELAALRFCELLADQGAQVHPGQVVAVGETPWPATVLLRTERVHAVLGTEIDRSSILAVLEPLGFACGSTPAGEIQVTVPSWRPDVTLEIDLIEEIARHYGYDRLGKSIPTSPRAGGLTARQLDQRGLRSMLVAQGFSEAAPIPFLSPEDLERSGVRADAVVVANPLVFEESVLRTSLLPGLLKTLGTNAAHRNTGLSVFELGHCFARGAEGGLPDEWEELGAVMGSKDAADAVRMAKAVASRLGVLDVTIVSEPVGGLHPGRSAVIYARGVAVGVVGEVHPGDASAHGVTERVGYFSFCLGGPEPWHGGDGLLTVPRKLGHAAPVSRFPSSDLDLAFLAPVAVAPDKLLASIREAGGELVVAAALFDVYRGQGVPEGFRGLGFRFRLQAPDRTLTDAEVVEVRTRLLGAASAMGAELR
ncbi:MAG TPA: phenylalanine--tRNA ligase subunit beta [Acidimicrobiaceae bacterium]|nr:phenylalanine--tRNA ligase subunit beta [Acidimicrobiaceae bacterium]